MTYSKRFGNYGVYTDGMLYKWFKDEDKALAFWETVERTSDEWLDEYDTIELRDMKDEKTIRILEV